MGELDVPPGDPAMICAKEEAVAPSRVAFLAQSILGAMEVNLLSCSSSGSLERALTGPSPLDGMIQREESAIHQGKLHPFSVSRRQRNTRATASQHSPACLKKTASTERVTTVRTCKN